MCGRRIGNGAANHVQLVSFRNKRLVLTLTTFVQDIYGELYVAYIYRTLIG